MDIPLVKVPNSTPRMQFTACFRVAVIRRSAAEQDNQRRARLRATNPSSDRQ